MTGEQELSPDAVDQWFADGMSDDGNQRVMDVIFIGPRVGACVRCLPERTRAQFILWETIVDPSFLDEPGVAPYSHASLLCGNCVAERRAEEIDTPDPAIVLVRIAQLA